MKMDTQVDVNITPVIDCLTVLITFLLASASFLTIAAFDAGYATDKLSQSTAEKGAPEVKIAFNILMNGMVEISREVKGKITSESVAITALGAKLNELRSASADELVSLDAESQVNYEKVIETMDLIKRQFPQVVMGGLE